MFKENASSEKMPALLICLQATSNSSKYAQPIQIAWRELGFNDDGKLKEINPYWLMSGRTEKARPTHDIDCSVSAETGLTMSDVYHEDYHDDVMQQLFHFYPREMYIFSHNAEFEKQLLINSGVDVSGFKFICTQALARRRYPDANCYSIRGLMCRVYVNKFDSYSKQSFTSCGYVSMFYYEIIKRLSYDFKSFEALYQASETALIDDMVMPVGQYKGEKMDSIIDTYSGGERYLQYVVDNFEDQPYLIKACQRAIDRKNNKDAI